MQHVWQLHHLLGCDPCMHLTQHTRSKLACSRGLAAACQLPSCNSYSHVSLHAVEASHTPVTTLAAARTLWPLLLVQRVVVAAAELHGHAALAPYARAQR